MESKRLARFAVQGVGDAKLGEWEGIHGRADVWHVQRRLTAEEREEFGVPEPIDIRGTAEEGERMACALAEYRRR